jgi:hypothetical protein
MRQLSSEREEDDQSQEIDALADHCPAPVCPFSWMPREIETLESERAETIPQSQKQDSKAIVR